MPYYSTMTVSGNYLSILGCGNIGSEIAMGLVNAKLFTADRIILTRRSMELLKPFAEKGFAITADNKEALKKSDIVIITVTPQHLNDLLEEIKNEVNPGKHTVLSVVSGASIKQIKNHIGKEVPVVRVMPNTAIGIRESMTCICGDEKDRKALQLARQICDALGKTIEIHEDLMIPATALCACGIAFFLRAVRAASQGGIEIGFHAEEALLMAAQTAKGAASILLEEHKHPEREVDKVTTPQGCTIAGLNQMEHSGFSSSLIKGIVTSAEKAATLYSNND